MTFHWCAEATYDGLTAASPASGTEKAAVRVIGDSPAPHDPVSAQRNPAVVGRRGGGR